MIGRNIHSSFRIGSLSHACINLKISAYEGSDVGVPYTLFFNKGNNNHQVPLILLQMPLYLHISGLLIKGVTFSIN